MNDAATLILVYHRGAVLKRERLIKAARCAECRAKLAEGRDAWAPLIARVSVGILRSMRWCAGHFGV